MKLTLHKTLKILLDEKGMNASQLARATKIPNSTIGNWLSGLEPRNLIQLKIVANYFDVTVDYLLYSSQERKNLKTLNDFKDEINAGIFEVVLRRIKK